METDFGYAIWLCDDEYDVIETDQRMAFDLGGRILAFGTHGEQMNQLDVVVQQGSAICPFTLGLHAVDQIRHIALLVEYEHVVRADQLESQGTNISGV